MGTQSENQFRAEARDANNEVKGGVISDFIFNLFPSSKKWPKSQSLNFLLYFEKSRDSDLVHFHLFLFFWGWNQVENTFWDYPIFKGVYSWLDALGNEHTVAYNSGTVYIFGQ
jgi:hypothetical protein